jgi:hypothetical protein
VPRELSRSGIDILGDTGDLPLLIALTRCPVEIRSFVRTYRIYVITLKVFLVEKDDRKRHRVADEDCISWYPMTTVLLSYEFDFIKNTDRSSTQTVLVEDADTRSFRMLPG